MLKQSTWKPLLCRAALIKAAAIANTGGMINVPFPVMIDDYFPGRVAADATANTVGMIDDYFPARARVAADNMTQARHFFTALGGIGGGAAGAVAGAAAGGVYGAMRQIDPRQEQRSRMRAILEAMASGALAGGVGGAAGGALLGAGMVYGASTEAADVLRDPQGLATRTKMSQW